MVNLNYFKFRKNIKFKYNTSSNGNFLKSLLLQIYSKLLLIRILFFKYRLGRNIYKNLWETIGKFRSKDIVNNLKLEKSNKNIQKKNINKVFSQLNKKGFVYFHYESNQFENFVFKQNQLIEYSLKLINSIDKNKWFYGQKKYLRNLNKKHLPKKYLKNLYEYFTNEIFIDIARCYFGEEPLLSELSLIYSPICQDSDKTNYNGSQCWHCDFDDTKVLKFYLYLNDVKEDSGPLNIIDKKNTNKILKERNYVWSGPKSHDDSLAPEGVIKYTKMIANKGSIIIADTANCLHRGSRDTKKERIVLLACFHTKTSFRFTPINWILPKPFSELLLLYSSPLSQLDKDRLFLNEYALNK